MVADLQVSRDRLLLAAEGDWPYRRRLTGIEAASGIDVPELDYNMQVGLEALLAAWHPIRTQHVADLLEQVERRVQDSPAGDVSWVGKLKLPAPDVGRLSAAMLLSMQDGRRMALLEAHAQNPRLAERAAATPRSDPGPRVDAHAKATERLLAAALVQSASREALRLTTTGDAVDVPGHVSAVLGSMASLWERDVLQGLATGSVNEGRYTVPEAIERAGATGGLLQAADAPKIVAIYSLEILDSNTCDECELIDGQEYATIEAARKDYPGVGGGYIRCKGRERCRGSLVMIYDTEAKPTGTPGKLFQPVQFGGDLNPLLKGTPSGGAPLPGEPGAQPVDPATIPKTSMLSTFGQTLEQSAIVLLENLTFARGRLAKLLGDERLAALTRYSTTERDAINATFSGVDDTLSIKDAKAIQSLLADAKARTKLSADTVVHKVMWVEQSKLDAGLAGKVIEEPGFLSGGYTAQRAMELFDPLSAPSTTKDARQVLLNIHVRNGKSFLPLDLGTAEDILMAPGARLYIYDEASVYVGAPGAGTARRFNAVLLKPGEGLPLKPLPPGTIQEVKILDTIGAPPAVAEQLLPSTLDAASVEELSARAALHEGQALKETLASIGNAQTREGLRALEHYMNYGHTAINAYLRDGVLTDKAAVAEAKAMTRLFAKAETSSAFAQDTLLYRGLMLPADFGVGSTITDRAFASTSVSPKGAAEFARPKKGVPAAGKVPVILRLHTPTGTRFLTGNDFEGEAILQPGTRYVVLRESPAELQIPGGKYTPEGVKTYDAVALPLEEQAPLETLPGGAEFKPPPTWDQPSWEITDKAQSELRRASRALSKYRRDASDAGDAEAFMRTDALSTYTGSGYQDMNHMLRHGTPKPGGFMSAVIAQQHVRRLVELFDTPATVEFKEPVLLHRGMSVAQGEQLIGKVKLDPGVLSTSLNQGTSSGFLGYGSRPGREKIMVRAHVQAGARALRGNSAESELIFAPNTPMLFVREVAPFKSGGANYRQFDVLVGKTPITNIEVAGAPAAVDATQAVKDAKVWKGGQDAGTIVKVYDPQKLGGKEFTPARIKALFQSPKLTELDLRVDVAVSLDPADRIMLRGRIKNAAGDELGSFTRVWTQGAESIEHTFSLDATLQGQGIARDLIKGSHEIYYKAGIKEAHVLATGPGGRYAWARYGFDFANPDMIAATRSAFRQKLLQEITQQLLVEPNGALRAVVQDPSKLDFYFPQSTKLIAQAQHSWEFAGLALDEGGITLSGRQVLSAGSDWTGILDLRAATPSKKAFLNYVYPKGYGK